MVKKHKHPREDGGLTSRKLWLAVFGMLLLTGVAALTLKYAMLEAIYSSLATGILGLYALYSGANGAIKYFYSKNPVPPAPEAPKPPEPPAQ